MGIFWRVKLFEGENSSLRRVGSWKESGHGVRGNILGVARMVGFELCEQHMNREEYGNNNRKSLRISHIEREILVSKMK